jgi:hypothetical protein
MEFPIGKVFIIPYPFKRAEYNPWYDLGAPASTWEPGTYYVPDPDNYAPDDPSVKLVCDGIGSQLLTVVLVVKPGKYPTRVFFTQKWISPDGNEFGKNKLRCAVIHHFRKKTQGYSLKYELLSNKVDA